MDKVDEMMSKRKEVLESSGIKVVKEVEEDNIIQVEFKSSINKKDFKIVMQVEDPLKIADMQSLFLDYTNSRISNSCLIEEINNMNIIVNNKNLLDSLINNSAELKEINLREKGRIITSVLNMFIYFCTFCIPLFN